MHRWKVILRYGLVFALGLLLGLAGSHFAIKHRLARVLQDRPAAQRQMVMRHLTRQLELTKPQQLEIERIVNARVQALAELRERNQPEIRAIFQHSLNEMKTHLTSEQQQKLDRIGQRLQQPGSAGALRPGMRGSRFSERPGKEAPLPSGPMD
ncbi:MAG: hypothetical protein HYV36_00515 [Lentisphaerae bacterium]|nr:hypothetical protein [Lentisphaerota bacterium]